VSNDSIFSDWQGGFTLVELLVSLVIFIVIMLGLAKVEISTLVTQRGNAFRNEALRLAGDELGRLKGLRFSVAGTSAELNPAAWSDPPQTLTVKMRNGDATFARSVQITDIPATSIPMKRIDVAVGWSDASSASPTKRKRQTSLSTIIVQSN
jgi:prepilin-type N-terminal cleavage/methylation domain-containing protein